MSEVGEPTYGPSHHNLISIRPISSQNDFDFDQCRVFRMRQSSMADGTENGAHDH
jgi:hypothetical protein